MKQSWIVVLFAAVAASMSACGQQVAQRPDAQRLTPTDRVVATSAQPAGFGFNDFPTWMPHTASEAWQSDDHVAPKPVVLPACPREVSPHFDTPEAAMTYLASAWNRDDLADLCQVTSPDARLLLVDMHREAVNLRLNHCDKDAVGAYSCLFDHDYPKRMHKKGVGHAILDVAAAEIPGWYMDVFDACG